jgi:hypothetical protein
MSLRSSSTGPFAFAGGVAGLLLPALILLETRSSPGLLADRSDVIVAHAQLRRVLREEFDAQEGARRADPVSLNVASLGDERLLAGLALPSPAGPDGKIGFVLVLAGAGEIVDGHYELRVPGSGVAVDLVDASGRVVATIPLDLPFMEGSDVNRWQRCFLTVARFLAPKLR